MATKTKSKKMTDAQEWELVANKVKNNAEELASMTSHAELFRWSRDNELDKPWLFKKFKAELFKQLDIKYDELRDAAVAARKAEIAAEAGNGPQITLFCAGDAEANSFAICDAEGGVLWYADFHREDRIAKADDQLSADLSAADKAVFLAGKAREDAEAPAGRLRLTVSNHEISAERLAVAAVKARLQVEVEISDGDNPALEWCREAGSKSWREVRLRDLVDSPEDTQ